MVISSNPRLSIFIPVYNGEKYLSQAVESLLAQDFCDFELIIADDGSEDNSREIASGYARSDVRVKVLSFSHAGEVSARNAALRHCTPDSRYLLNHDADDISLPGKLSRLTGYLDEHPEIAVVGCLAEYFDDRGNVLGLAPIETEPQEIKETFGVKNSMINSASIFRREVFERIGGYREEYRLADDYDFFAQALLAGFSLVNVSEILHRIRVHSKSLGQAYKYQVAYVAERVRFHYNLSMAQSRPGRRFLSIFFNSLGKTGRAYLRYRLAWSRG